jgi:AhpD family alkylhydroperoxidase
VVVTDAVRQPEEVLVSRIPLPPPSLTGRAAAWYSRRRYGAVLDPLQAMAHQPHVLRTNGRYELSLARWHALDHGLKTLAVMAASTAVGCSWCVDFGYWEARSQGLDEQKVRDLPRWRDSDAYTRVERRVLGYAEAMSGDIDDVTDEMVEQLRADLGDPALVELTMMVAVENSRSRFNGALGLVSQGFRDRCELPAERP